MKVVLCSRYIRLCKFLKGDELVPEVEEVADTKGIHSFQKVAIKARGTLLSAYTLYC